MHILSWRAAASAAPARKWLSSSWRFVAEAAALRALPSWADSCVLWQMTQTCCSFLAALTPELLAHSKPQA